MLSSNTDKVKIPTLSIGPFHYPIINIIDFVSFERLVYPLKDNIPATEAVLECCENNPDLFKIKRLT